MGQLDIDGDLDVVDILENGRMVLGFIGDAELRAVYDESHFPSVEVSVPIAL